MTFSSRIIKGGALLEDTKRLLELWDPEEDEPRNLRRILGSGGLAKSGARQEDLLAVLRRRYVEGGPHVIRTLKVIAHDPRAFREACYYETCRTDDLLAAFAAGPLFGRYWGDGRNDLAVDDVTRWLRSELGVPGWGEYTTRRVARGILSALRDFGILEGAKGGRRKRILPPHLSMRGFAYVALRERGRLPSDRALLASPAWRWYLLDEAALRRLFLEADRHGILRYSEAGSVVRVDWVVRDLEEVGRVPAA
ncbi:MAG TPA: BrxA family protein [Actinomycetota bacterium]|nr:BrxA family protein [Actinomycetota bacterium]